MERYDRIISLIWIILGVSQCVGSWFLDLGNMSEPGTGFMPFVVGLAIIALAIMRFIESSREVKKNPRKKVSLWADTHWKRVVFIIVLMLFYALFLPKLGYLWATFLLMVFLLKSGEPLRWPTALIVGALTSGISYLIFDVWLQVSFPRGMLSF